MTTKHFFSDTTGIVVLGLESLVSRNSHLALDAPNKVVYSKTHSPAKVSVISGGGSGHEPAWSGYVGDGMLAAAVNGEVFASPATKQVMAAIEHVPSEAGIILCITNYTGDNLHFGLAREKAVGLGYKIGMLRMTDDVGLGRKQTENLGRRGLAGNMFVLKLCGAASHESWGFEKCFELGQSVNDHCVTIGSSLDYCHIPGRMHHEALAPDTYSVAQGIHNEAGLKEISPIPSAQEMISQLLIYLLDPHDKDRAFVSFSPTDSTALLINNFGGVSNFELEALTALTLQLLQKDWGITPRRTLAQCFETSLNAPGWSISLLNISGISRETGISVEKIFGLLDKETNAPAWPRNGYKNVTPTGRTAHRKDSKATNETKEATGPTVNNKILKDMLKTACEGVITAEPDITKWDQQMGDGDCGEAVSSICSSVLERLDSGLCGEQTDTIALLPVLDVLGECIEEVGGTLGAILAIFVASFTSALRTTAASTSTSSGTETVDVLAAATSIALKNLQCYTPARVGGRTVMDTLIPFCDTLTSSSDFAKAVDAGAKGARSTDGMSATYGRAAYLDSEKKGDVHMDPGAWAAAVFLEGLLKGSERE